MIISKLSRAFLAAFLVFSPDAMAKRSVLDCQPKGEIATSASPQKTEAGACPDCEQLKNSSFKSLLSVKEFIDPISVKVTVEDNKNVMTFVSEALNPKPYFNKKYLEERIASLEKKGALYDMCITGKFNAAAANLLIYNNKTGLYRNVHSELSTEKLQAHCEKYYKSHGYSYSNSASSKWYANQLQYIKSEIEGINAEKIEFSKKELLPLNYDTPEWAQKAGADKCGLTKEEFALIYSYTGSFFQYLNPALRGQKTEKISATQA